jgi:hypothetical protein
VETSFKTSNEEQLQKIGSVQSSRRFWRIISKQAMKSSFRKLVQYKAGYVFGDLFKKKAMKNSFRKLV